MNINYTHTVLTSAPAMPGFFITVSFICTKVHYYGDSELLGGEKYIDRYYQFY